MSRYIIPLDQPSGPADAQIAELPRFMAHLDELLSHPAQSAEAQLFDHVELQINETNIPHLSLLLLPKLMGILKTSNSDLKPIASLITKLLGPVNFDSAFRMTDGDQLIVALTSPAPCVNMLALFVLRKASTPADLYLLSTCHELLSQLITTWLCTPHVDVGEEAGRVLGNLLRADAVTQPVHPPEHSIIADRVPLTNGHTPTSPHHDSPSMLRGGPGPGHIWDAIFENYEIYNLFFSLPVGQAVDGAPEMTQQQKTLAQGRMLRLIPHLATMNFRQLVRPLDLNRPIQDPDLAMPGGFAFETVPPRSLLNFVGVGMIDMSDELMFRTYLDFLEAMFSLMRLQADERDAEYTRLIRATLRDLLPQDDSTRARVVSALLTLHERTIPEEAEGLEQFILEVLH